MAFGQFVGGNPAGSFWGGANRIIFSAPNTFQVKISSNNLTDNNNNKYSTSTAGGGFTNGIDSQAVFGILGGNATSSIYLTQNTSTALLTVSASSSILNLMIGTSTQSVNSLLTVATTSNILSILNTGKIGIGTANPAFTFDVNDYFQKKKVSPDMTADNAPVPYVAAASTEANGLNAAWMAFDHDNTDKWTASAATGWISIDLNTATTVNYYRITGAVSGQTNFSPKTWTLEGSSDNLAGTTLDTQTNAAAWAAVEERTFTISPVAYRYYRLNVSANEGGANLSIANLQLLVQGLPELQTRPGQLVEGTANLVLGLTSSTPVPPISTGGVITTPFAQLVLSETGDTLGTVSLTLQNRTNSNGAIFSNGNVDLVDFGFYGSTGAGAQRNIRYENRVIGTYHIGSPEFEIGSAGSPGLVIADAATAVTKGTFGVNTTTPSYSIDALGNERLQNNQTATTTLQIIGAANQTANLVNVLSSTGQKFVTISSSSIAQFNDFTSATGTSPTIGNAQCGTNPGVPYAGERHAVGSNGAGYILVGSGVVNSCQFYFASTTQPAFMNRPSCTVQDESLAYTIAVPTSSLTVNATAMQGTFIDFHCWGVSEGG